MSAGAHRGSLAVICALILLGCQRFVDLRVPFPPRSADVRSMIVVFEGTGPPFVEAYAARDGIKIERSGYEQLSVLYYAQDLETLGLTEGTVASVDPRECGATPLPAMFASGHTRALVADVELEPITALSPSISAFRYKRDCPCATFAEIGRLPMDARTVFDWLALDDETVLLATSSGLRQVTRAGTVTPATPDRRAYTGIHRARDGSIWLSSADGSLSHGSIAGGFVVTASVTATSTAPSAIAAMDAPRGDEAFELYTIHENDELRRYDGSDDWEVIFDLPNSDSNQAADVSWIGPGRVIALQHSGSGPIFYDRSKSDPAKLEEWNPIFGPPSGVGGLDGLGVFLATRTFNIYRYDELARRWDLIVDEGTQQGTVRDFLPFNGGFLFAGQNARFGQYHSTEGFCFDTNLEGNLIIRVIATMGDDRVLLAGEQAVGNFMYVMERER